MEVSGTNKLILPKDIILADRERERTIVYYGRVSTEHEAQLSALENQLQWYDDQSKYHPNWKVLRKYIDEGITGTQAKKRPAFLKMLEDAKNGQFDLIVTREVCRFARNTVDTLVTTRELKKIGVEVYFVEDNIWTMDGDGELRLTIMATLAQEESRKTSERVRAGQKISRDNGVLYGNGNILGYDRVGDTYVINEEQAETVRLIYNLYSQGLGFKKIINELVSQHRKDSYGLVRWECTKISRILHNATYKGYMGYLKSFRNNYLEQKSIINRDESTHLYIKGNFEPIVSEELWEKCRQIRESKAMKIKSYGGKERVVGFKPSNDIWVKKMKCRCGSSFRRCKWHKNKSGELIYGYQCYNQLNNGSKKIRESAGISTEGYCDMGTIGDWKIDMMAQKIFQGLCGEQRECINRSYSIYENNFKAKGNNSNNQKEVLLSKIEKLKVKLNNLTNMRMEGEISKEEYQEYRQKVTDEIATFQKKLKALVEERKEPDPAVIKMSLDDFAAILIEKIDFNAPIIDRGIIEQFVEKIVPINTLEFDWYLNLIPHIFEDNSSTGYNEVWTFVINFDEAEKYRKLRAAARKYMSIKRAILQMNIKWMLFLNALKRFSISTEVWPSEPCQSSDRCIKKLRAERRVS